MFSCKYKLAFATKLLFFFLVCTKLFAYTTNSDFYNIYKYSTHFRTIIGKYHDDSSSNQLTDDILSIAENVWQKEVVEYKFLAPRNSDKKHIDIYIGNKDAYNFEDKSSVSISSAYAGYALYYQDQTPYFVLSLNISENVRKITIAHEFFHTIQYSYIGDFNTWSDTFFYQNVWWLEATAVMMEDEVYDSVNDYILNYVPEYYKTLSDSLENYGDRIYGEVLLAKYLEDRFGMDFIKDIFKNFDNTRFLQKIKDLVEEKGISFKDFMNDYAYSLIHTENFESDEPIPAVTPISTIPNIGAGGIGYLGLSDDYFVSSNNQYDMILDDKQTRILSNLNPIIITTGLNTVNSTLIKSNQYKSIELKIGWNMIGNSFGEPIALNNFKKAKILWKYDGKYCAYSSDANIQNTIKNKALECLDDVLFEGEGIWAYSSEDINISINSTILTSNKKSFTNKYKLYSFSSTFDVNFLKDVIVFTYENDKWSYFTDKNITLNIDKIKTIKPQTGYFIKEVK
jgi:hypothetical protein